MIENPILSGCHPGEITFEPKLIGECTYIYCKEEIYEKDGFERNGLLFCSTDCVGSQMQEDGEIVDLSITY